MPPLAFLLPQPPILPIAFSPALAHEDAPGTSCPIPSFRCGSAARLPPYRLRRAPALLGACNVAVNLCARKGREKFPRNDSDDCGAETRALRVSLSPLRAFRQNLSTGHYSVGIIPLVAGGLQVMSGNRAFLKTFPQVNAIILESCRLFSAAHENVLTGGFAPKPCYSTSDYSFSAFPQVRRAIGRYRQLLQVRGGTAAVPPPVLRWYCDFGPFPGTGNNGKPWSRPGSVLRKTLVLIIEWE